MISNKSVRAESFIGKDKSCCFSKLVLQSPAKRKKNQKPIVKKICEQSMMVVVSCRKLNCVTYRIQHAVKYKGTKQK